MKRILFLTQGDLQTASSRHRVYLYLPALEKAGHQAVVYPAVTAEEFQESFIDRTTLGGLRRLMRTFTRRIRNLHEVQSFDYVYIQKPILPAPLFNIEAKIVRESKVIFDFDDAVYLKKPGGYSMSNFWSQQSRIASICRKAHRVVTGNEFLADFVNKLRIEPVVIPTVVDTDAFDQLDGSFKRDHKIPVIGWVGSPSTQPDLKLVLPSLIDLHSKAPFVVRFIGAQTASMPVRFPVEWKSWSLETEKKDISSLEIGLAPLHETPWNRAKCGLKILQYWAASVPVVASPVGIQKDLIVDGENGLLATSRTEWTEQLLRLMKDPVLYRKLAENGRRTVKERYSLHAMTPKFLSLFEEPPPPNKN